MRGHPGYRLDVSIRVLARIEGRMVWARSVVTGEQPRLVLRDLSGQDVHVVPEFSYPDAGHGRGRLSSDRAWVVTYAARPASPMANRGLYLVDLSTGASRILLDTMYGHQISPTWFPGDTMIVFLANRSGAWELWSVRPDDTELQQRTNLRWSRPSRFDIAPNGNVVIPFRTPEGGSDLYEMTLSGDTVRRLTHSPRILKSSPAVSPDGATIAFETAEAGVRIWLVCRDGSDLRRLTKEKGVVLSNDGQPSQQVAGMRSPSWTPDGQFVLATWLVDPSPPSGVAYPLLGEIYAIRVADRLAVRLTRWPAFDGEAVAR